MRKSMFIFFICFTLCIGCNKNSAPIENTKADTQETTFSATAETNTENTTTTQENTINLKTAFDDEYPNEKIMYFLEEDYDGDGKKEAFVITTDQYLEEDLELGKIWFVNCKGEIIHLNDGDAIWGSLNTLWSDAKKPLLVAGNQKFLVWDSQTSRIFGVKNEEAYEPKVSGIYLDFWINDSDYAFEHDGSNYSDFYNSDYYDMVAVDPSFYGFVGYKTDFSGDTIQWIPQYFQFDAKTGEFINENPQPDNKEDLLKEQEKLEGNISEYLGKNINEVVKKFDNMREYEPAFGVWYGNEYVELYSEDVYDANNNPIITSITICSDKSKYNLYGLKPGMSFDEAKSLWNKIGKPEMAYDDFCVFSIEPDRDFYIGHKDGIVTSVDLTIDY